LLKIANFDELEAAAKKYLNIRKKGPDSESQRLALGIVDFFAFPKFAFPLRKEAVITKSTTTYLYVNNSAFPSLFEFISEVLHMNIPIIINAAKFGPGEIIIEKENEKDARDELDSCVKELQKLVTGKKSRILDQSKS
jgi:hypothetical protein